jgi:CelD/BcsL family acetyltransferase involved in cellulose biosynthesis
LTSPPAFTTRILTDPPTMRALLPEWQRLWDRCPRATTFQRPQWLLSWIDNFWPSHPRMIEFRLHDDLVALIPLLIYSRDAERVLALMGGGVSDYLDALIEPEYERDVLLVLPAILHQEISGWDILHLTDVPATSALLENSASHGMEILPHDVCPVLDLPSRVQELRTMIPFRKMANLRNARNRMAKAGPIQLEVASSDTVLPMLDTLFRMHTSRWQNVGQSGVVEDDKVRQFHRRLAPALVEQGVLRLYALSLSRQPIAMLYTFFERETVLLYLHAFDLPHAHFSPGTYIFGAVIEDAIRAGKRQVNFLRGKEPYKYLWGSRDTTTFALQVSAATMATAPGTAVA